MKYVEGVKDDNGRQWGSDVLSEKPIRSLNYTKTIGNWEEKNTIPIWMMTSWRSRHSYSI